MKFITSMMKDKVQIKFINIICLMHTHYTYAHHILINISFIKLTLRSYFGPRSHELDKFVHLNEHFTSLCTKLHPPNKFAYYQYNLLFLISSSIVLLGRSTFARPGCVLLVAAAPPLPQALQVFFRHHVGGLLGPHHLRRRLVCGQTESLGGIGLADPPFGAGVTRFPQPRRILSAFHPRVWRHRGAPHTPPQEGSVRLVR